MKKKKRFKYKSRFEEKRKTKDSIMIEGLTES